MAWRRGVVRRSAPWSLLTAALLLAGALEAAAEERVVDELLEILRRNGQITQQQYEDLKRKAEDERLQDLRKQAEAAPTPAPTAAPEAMRAYFKDGYNLESNDGNFKVNIATRVLVDWNVSQSSPGIRKEFGLSDVEDGVEFRRARLSLAGIVYRVVDYKIEYDFATGEAAAKDVYVGVHGVPLVQYLRVGHFKEPYSLEEITSDNWVTFMERGLPNAFSPARNTGIGILPTEWHERLTFAAGAFRDTNDAGFGFGPDSAYDISARLTGLPWYEAAGERLLHLGFSYSHGFRHDDPVQFASRPESHLYPAELVNTGPISSDGFDLIDPEVALVLGPLSLQAEYMSAFVEQHDGDNLAFGGFYAFASYFLTGEHRAYRTSTGAFERLAPYRNFNPWERGWGAWEVAARISRLNLDSHNIHGGALDDVTAGLTWYLNPYSLISANYIRAHLEAVGDSNVFQGRFQFAF